MEEQVQIKDERRMLLKILRTACDYVVDMLNFDRRIRDAGQEIEDLLRWKEERQNVKFYCRRWVSILLGIPLGIKLAYDLLLFFPSINNFMLTFDSNGPLFVTMNFSFIGVCCVAVIIALHGIQRLLALPRVSAFKKEWEISGVQKLHDLEARRTALVKEKEALVKDQAAAVLSLMPPKYIYLEAIDFFIEMVVNMRADSMKEAVNLYEEHLHRMRLEASQKQIAEQQERILQIQQENQAILNSVGDSVNDMRASLRDISVDMNTQKWLTYLSMINYSRKTDRD